MMSRTATMAETSTATRTGLDLCLVGCFPGGSEVFGVEVVAEGVDEDTDDDVDSVADPTWIVNCWVWAVPSLLSLAFLGMALKVTSITDFGAFSGTPPERVKADASNWSQGVDGCISAVTSTAEGSSK
jgi:hypothetical protein